MMLSFVTHTFFFKFGYMTMDTYLLYVYYTKSKKTRIFIVLISSIILLFSQCIQSHRHTHISNIYLTLLHHSSNRKAAATTMQYVLTYLGASVVSNKEVVAMQLTCMISPGPVCVNALLYTVSVCTRSPQCPVYYSSSAAFKAAKTHHSNNGMKPQLAVVV